MILERKIAVVGGDLRSVKLVEMLEKDDYDVSVYGLENADILNQYASIKKCSSIDEVIEENDIIIGPIPFSSNKNEINMLFSNEKLEVEEFFNKITANKVVIAGSISEDYVKKAEANGAKVIDILKREELAVLNAISTAEGTINIAIQETSRTLHGSNVLVMGFGRVGKVLAKMLDGIGANVYCEARKNVDLAWVKAYGYHPIHLNDLDEHLGKFDIIINTIPFIVLDDKKLDLIKQNCLIIDIASNPGGVDKNAAKAKGIKSIWALSLPGKVAPVTSAEFIKDTIYNIMKEL